MSDERKEISRLVVLRTFGPGLRPGIMNAFSVTGVRVGEPPGVIQFDIADVESRLRSDVRFRKRSLQRNLFASIEQWNEAGASVSEHDAATWGSCRPFRSAVRKIRFGMRRLLERLLRRSGAERR